MDALGFGRWVSERRRASGWRSQHALAEAARADPDLRAAGISEAFLARLEAGLLAHPFRGIVRRRVLALAWLLCKSQQEVRAYLSASEVTDLSAAEAAWLGQLRAQLATPQRASPCFLPPLSPLLIGREAIVEEVLQAITTGPSGLYAITGMPGVGKSVLAS